MARIGTHSGDYDPLEVTVLVAGLPVTGFAEGKMVGIARNAPTSKRYTGSQGESSRCISTDNTYTVTLMLQQTSPWNNILQGFSTADRFSNAPPFLQVRVTDRGGQEQFNSVNSYIEEEPEREWSNEISIREWKIVSLDGIFTPNTNAGSTTQRVPNGDAQTV